MSTRHRDLAALALAALVAGPAAAADAAPTPADMYRLIQQLQGEIRSLQSQLADQQQQSAAQTQTTQAQQQQIEALAEQSESAGTASRVTLGGYGELHYNNLDSKREIDFHRFVLYAGYNFSDRIRFASEVEIEHALTKDNGDATCTDANGNGTIEASECQKSNGKAPGEVELEQAYIEFDLAAQQKARGGLFLLPIGILNETHEPTTFYGVERNPVESAIIPSTWWEAGASLGGPIAATGLSYDIAVHSGLKLPTSGSSAYLIRSGRQKVASAPADDLAYTGRLRYTGVPGLELATSVQYQADATQAADAQTVSALLTEAHAVFEKGPFSARALWAAWNLDGAGPKAAGRDRQDGHYGELAYRVLPQLGLFTRYSVTDNGGTTADTEIRQTDVGLNWWPHPDVVIKADYQNQDNAADNDGFNLGIGYRF